MKKKWTKSSGFTLAELLIVVAIIAVLVAISIPIFTSQLEKAREATDLSDVRSAYAEVMMAAISDDTTATYSKDSSQTIHKSNGLYSVTVSPLHQEQDNWQGNMDLNVGGVSSKDTTHWIGTPKAAGSCEVSYNPQGDSIVLNWSGKSTGGGNTGGGGTVTPGGGTTGGGSTPAPNPGTGGGTTGGTTGGNNNQGNTGTGDNTGSGNNNQGNTGGNTGGSTGGNTSGSDQENNNSGDKDTSDNNAKTDDDLSKDAIKDFTSNPIVYSEKPTNNIAFNIKLGNVYTRNGLIYVALTDGSYTNDDNYAAPDDNGRGQSWFVKPTWKVLTKRDLEDKYTTNDYKLYSLKWGDLYKEGDDYYLCLSDSSTYYPPSLERENIKPYSSSGYWLKVNFKNIENYY